MFTEELESKQKLVAKFFESVFRNEKLANSYLFLGDAFEDKLQTALEITMLLNCEGSEQADSEEVELEENLEPQACLECTNCKWILEGTHPMTPIYLEPKEESKRGIISVDQIKSLRDELSKSSQYYRVIILTEANYNVLGKHSANALLKIVEEPNSNILFLLFANDADMVLPTIVSRSQAVNFQYNPEHEFSEEALELRDAYYPKYFARLEKAHFKKDRLAAFDLAEELSKSDNSEILEFLELLQDKVSTDVSSSSNIGFSQKDYEVLMANRVEAIESAKNDIRSFVRPKIAIEQMLAKL